LSTTIIPTTIHEALNHPRWRQAMIDKMQAFTSNGMWQFIPLPSRNKSIGCRRAYALKLGLMVKLGLKTRFVAKGYIQIYGLNYYDTIFPMAKINTIIFFLAIATIRHWSLYQLDIKNVFLVVILRKKFT